MEVIIKFCRRMGLMYEIHNKEFPLQYINDDIFRIIDIKSKNTLFIWYNCEHCTINKNTVNIVEQIKTLKKMIEDNKITNAKCCICYNRCNKICRCINCSEYVCNNCSYKISMNKNKDLILSQIKDNCPKELIDMFIRHDPFECPVCKTVSQKLYW